MPFFYLMFLDRFYKNPLPKPMIFLIERFIAAQREEGRDEKLSTYIFLSADGSQTLSSGRQGKMRFRRNGEELVSKLKIS